MLLFSSKNRKIYKGGNVQNLYWLCCRTVKMYRRHNIWDEDKWDIHSSGSGGYAGHSSKESMQDYHKKESQKEYHKNEVYNDNKAEEDKNKGLYKSNEKEEEKKKEEKENEEKEKTIVDAVEQEEKYQKKEQEEEEFNNITKDIQQSNIENDSLNNKNNKETKKKNNKNIEEAIKVAIKEEKEIVHAD